MYMYVYVDVVTRAYVHDDLYPSCSEQKLVHCVGYARH